LKRFAIKYAMSCEDLSILVLQGIFMPPDESHLESGLRLLTFPALVFLFVFN